MVHENNKGLSVSKVPSSGWAFSKRGNAHRGTEHKQTGTPAVDGWEAARSALPTPSAHRPRGDSGPLWAHGPL